MQQCPRPSPGPAAAPELQGLPSGELVWLGAASPWAPSLLHRLSPAEQQQLRTHFWLFLLERGWRWNDYLIKGVFGSTSAEFPPYKYWWEIKDKGEKSICRTRRDEWHTKLLMTNGSSLKIRETNRYAYYAEPQFYVFYLCFVVLPARHKNAVYVKLFHFLFHFFW